MVGLSLWAGIAVHLHLPLSSSAASRLLERNQKRLEMAKARDLILERLDRKPMCDETANGGGMTIGIFPMIQNVIGPAYVHLVGFVIKVQVACIP